MTEVFETFTPEETLEIAERIGRKAGRGAVYALLGDLGVGKTVFSMGFAKGLGSRKPSFRRRLRFFGSIAPDGFRCIILTCTASKNRKR